MAKNWIRCLILLIFELFGCPSSSIS